MKPTLARGQCSCGAVRFAIDAPPQQLYVCHCSICRRSTGANGIAVLVLPRERLHWLQGQELIASWRKPDGDWQTWFCSVCGAKLPGDNDAATVFVPAASLVGGAEDALRVAHHLWVGSKAAWDEIGGSAALHAEGLSSAPPV